MGNCVLKGFGVEEMVKVVTSDGGMMELYAPITAECITSQFPGHAIFRGSDILSHKDELLAGLVYHLLPINTQQKLSSDTIGRQNNDYMESTPYRIPLDKQVFPRYKSRGVWKVKLVISPEQLSQILTQDARTEELIESIRTVAKCSNGHHSDHSSVSSTSKASFAQYGCHVD